jgi:predicted nuclease with TOPRIM domain
MADERRLLAKMKRWLLKLNQKLDNQKQKNAHLTELIDEADALILALRQEVETSHAECARLQEAYNELQAGPRRPV